MDSWRISEFRVVIFLSCKDVRSWKFLAVNWFIGQDWITIIVTNKTNRFVVRLDGSSENQVFFRDIMVCKDPERGKCSRFDFPLASHEAVYASSIHICWDWDVQNCIGILMQLAFGWDVSSGFIWCFFPSDSIQSRPLRAGAMKMALEYYFVCWLHTVDSVLFGVIHNLQACPSKKGCRLKCTSRLSDLISLCVTCPSLFWRVDSFFNTSNRKWDCR